MNNTRGVLRPLLQLMGKMRFQNDFDAYATVMQFVSRRALSRGSYRPLMLYGPRGCGKTRMATTILKVLGITNPLCNFMWRGKASGFELENALRSNGGVVVVVVRDVSGESPSLRNWLLQRYERRLSTDLIIEASDPYTFFRVGRLDFCDSVVFDGLPTDARKGGRYDD